APGPVLVRPRKAEREIDRWIIEKALKGALQKSLPVEPVVVEDKPVQSCLARHLDLTLHDVRLSQIVEPEISRNTRLVMPSEARSAASDVSPIGKAATPPFVVLGDRMELGKIEG